MRYLDVVEQNVAVIHGAVVNVSLISPSYRELFVLEPEFRSDVTNMNVF